ncbi:hypothetical protein C8Q77DRAFT_1070420 [Trametes polyzona]|nr:hypothetical protein C8Q77DRAFT_1070420 [Trametes polyzona]
MLSFANSFRAVARRQPCRLPPARTIASTSTQAPDPNSLDTLTDYIRDAEDLAASQDVAVEVGGASPAASTSSTAAKGFPTLKGFGANQFIQPKNFSREGYYKMSQRRFVKRPLLGPDASTSRYLDLFHQMDIDPLQECQNSKIMSRFVTTMGKIKGRNETNLTWKNQRRIGKAIRRSKMMGIIPVLSRRTLVAERSRGGLGY